MSIRKLKRRAQEMHGYPNVVGNSRGKPTWKYDPFTGEDYGLRRSRYKVRVIAYTGKEWRNK